MAKAKWRDETSYSQGESPRIARVWELRGNGLRVVVHRIFQCDGWFLSAYGRVNFEKIAIPHDGIDEAKRWALDEMRRESRRTAEVVEVLWQDAREKP